ncbi:MAG: hypothetical protein AAFQ94_11370 [Bacteroidota bacterium]
MRILLTLLALVVTFLAKGQDDKTPVYQITQPYLYSPEERVIYLDMNEAILLPADFKETDSYKIYYNDPTSNNRIEQAYQCRLILPDSADTSNDIMSVDQEVPLQLVGRPVLEVTLNSPMQYGSYDIRVVRDNQKLRWRKLEVQEPDPQFDGFFVKYPNRETIDEVSRISFDGNESLRGMLVKLKDNPFYPEIKIGGLSLRPVTEGPNKGFYQAGAEWNEVIPDALNKIDPQLEIKKTLGTQYETVYAEGRVISLPVPVIESSLNEILSATESNFEFKLRVKNVFGIPKVHYRNALAGDLLYANGTTQKTKLNGDILSFELTLDQSKYTVTEKSIEFIVENQDGMESMPFITKLQQNPEGVTTRLLNQNTPFMAGFDSRVEFKLGISETEINKDSAVYIAINGTEQKLIDPGFSLDLKSVNGLVSFPENKEGDINFFFSYTDRYQNPKTLQGTLSNIILKPEVKIVTPLRIINDVYEAPVGQSFTINAIATEKLQLIEPKEELNFLSYSNNSMIDGRIVFTISNPVPTGETFSLSFRYETHAIKTFDFKVVKGIELSSLIVVDEINDAENTADSKPLNYGIYKGVDPLKISVNNQMPVDYSGMKATLMDHEGVVKGEGYYLNSADHEYNFLIDVESAGIRPGDLFYITYANPGSENFKQKYYYERKGVEQLLKVSTGLSAGTIYLKEKMLNDSTNLPNAEFTNGLNLTLSYNPNGSFFRGQKKNLSKQRLGIAFTVSALEGERVKMRMGAGVNIFETIVLGIDWGLSKQDQRAGLYIGVVSTFANIAGVFGGG